MRSSAAALHASSTDARFFSHLWKELSFVFHLMWNELLVRDLGRGEAVHGPVGFYWVEAVETDHLIPNPTSSRANSRTVLCIVSLLRVKVLKHCFSFFSRLFFFSPIVTVLCCRALNRTKTTVTGLPPLKVNVLKKTLLPKMLYCWMSQIMIYCRSYVLWNHSQEMCVNTSSM